MDTYTPATMKTFALPRGLSRADNAVMTFYTRHDQISGSHWFQMIFYMSKFCVRESVKRHSQSRILKIAGC